MPRTIEVEIDEAGQVHPLDMYITIPAGRGLLTLLPVAKDETHLLSERALSDWLRPEEDEAWAHLQPEK